MSKIEFEPTDNQVGCFIYTDLQEVKKDQIVEIKKLLDRYEGKFFLGDKVFYCDYNVYHHVSLALILNEKILDNYKNLKKFMNDFEKIKGISEYLNTRPKLIDIGTWPKVIIDDIEYTSGTNPDYKYQ